MDNGSDYPRLATCERCGDPATNWSDTIDLADGESAECIARWGLILCAACFDARYKPGSDWRPHPHFGTVAELRRALAADDEEKTL